ncbi:UNVERIFIED_CONTAM: hypothetical protein NCL1_25072 [Trichonephila clavipes]
MPERPGQQVAKVTVQLREDQSGRERTTVRPCPYYLRSTGIVSQPQDSLRRRSLSMEALDGDLADKST